MRLAIRERDFKDSRNPPTEASCGSEALDDPDSVEDADLGEIIKQHVENGRE